MDEAVSKSGDNESVQISTLRDQLIPEPLLHYAVARSDVLGFGRLFPIAGTASQGADSRDDPTTNIPDRRFPDFGFGGDIRTQV